MLLLLAIGPMITLSAVAQTPGAAERGRVAGTVEKLGGDRLTVNVADGRTQTVMLSADATIYGVEQRAVSVTSNPAILSLQGAFAAPTAKFMPLSCASFRNRFGGSAKVSPWDVRPEGVMTNATIGTVSQTTDGGIVHVTYKGGESEYVVGPEVPVLAYVLADRTLLINRAPPMPSRSRRRSMRLPQISAQIWNL